MAEVGGEGKLNLPIANIMLCTKLINAQHGHPGFMQITLKELPIGRFQVFVVFQFEPLLKVQLPYDPSCPSVDRSVCRFGHSFLKERDVLLPCACRSTC